MKTKKRIWRVLIFTLLVTALLLSACSSGDGVVTEAPAEADPSEETVDILPTAKPDEQSLTASQNVNVRSGPGTQYPVYKLMLGGERAKLLGVSTDGAYYAVDMPIVSPSTGWVDVNFATVTSTEGLPVLETPPTPPTAEFEPVEAGQPAVIAADAVYVRSGPSDHFPAYGIGQPGTRALLIGVSEDGLWWVIRLNPDVVGDGHGWLQKEFVTTENVPEDLAVITTPPELQTSEFPPPDTTGPYGIATNYLNVRSGPATNYPVLGIAAPSASATITGKSADSLWWQVSIGSQYASDGLGWVHGSYVAAYNVENVPVVEAPSPPPATEIPPATSVPPTGTVTCELVAQDPIDGTTFKGGETFDMTWDLKNVGTATWTVADALIIKTGAVTDQPLSDIVDLNLTADVATGEVYSVIVPMTSPSTVGEFGEYWTITMGGETICYFYNIIQVVE